MSKSICIKNIVEEDLVNYKLPSMFIGFPKCSFKCGKDVCQNYRLEASKGIEVDIEEIIRLYLSNPITEAIVCGGLEPFDTFDDLMSLCQEFRKVSNDPIVIYTGFTENEVEKQVLMLTRLKPLVIKFGRYLPGKTASYNSILGVNLASDNQYAKEWL